MIPAHSYFGVYFLVVTIVSLVVGFKYAGYSAQRLYDPSPKLQVGAVLLTAAMIAFIGFRPISLEFGDMAGYAEAMNDGRYEIHDGDYNFIFAPMMAFLSYHGADERVPIVLLAFLNFGVTYFAVRKLFPRDNLIAMLSFFSAFSTFGASTNGLKTGVAAAFFLLGIAYKDKLWLCVIALVLSLGFHHSMQLPVIAFLICLGIKNTRIYVLFWIFSFIIAALNISYFQTMFAGLTDEHGASYLLTNEDSWVTGFRLDFILYSLVPIFIGFVATVRRHIVSELYSFILNLYLLINGVWMLCMYASYTNRIAYLSWLLYPVLLIYPFLNEKWSEKQYSTARIVLYGQLLFSLSMNYVFG